MELEGNTIATIQNNTLHSSTTTELDRGTAAFVSDLTTAVGVVVADSVLPPTAALGENPLAVLTAVQAPNTVAILPASPTAEGQANDQGDSSRGTGAEDIKRTQCGVRRNEYAILVHVYRQLLTLPNEVRANYGPGLRDQLASFTGVGFSTAQKAIRYSKAGKIPADEASKVGRKPKIIDETYGTWIKEIVDRMNRDSIPASAVRIQAALKTDHGHDVTLTMLRRDLLRLGLKWVEGPSTRASTWKTRPDLPKRAKKGDKGKAAERGPLGH
ncbi:hypothetical protein B0O80DRAFT_503337 [Mortierella sp. GBAus27b]|nr:hypothetical protein BGX31_010517 [Mortierella sp. GBA43]KAI8346557.1 hypothetical protein B0O80DRAFT_503337 [Mortierella sp. GBAus27b]